MNSPLAPPRLRQDEPTWTNWAAAPASAHAPPALPDAPTGRLPDVIRRAWAMMPNEGESAFGFTLIRELGRGAFGRVFLAAQPELAGRFVALKISADLTGESRTLALLQHTNIVPVYSAHRSGSLQAVCMPYFGPTTLADVIAAHQERRHLPATGRELVDTLRNLSAPTGPGPASAARPRPAADSVFTRLSGLSYVRAVCWLAARVADGLAHAHDRGVLHRDIKPANVLVTDDGQPMLLDFGIAEELKARLAGGVVGGTLPYMAPESLDEILTGTASADGRSDVYSLGVVLFELLTGDYPFRLSAAVGEGGVRRMADERRGPPPFLRPHNPEVTPGLESIVRTCLEGDVSRRYPSAAALRDDLERYLADRPLKTAAEPSARERAAKWSRRHPRLTSTASLAVAAGLMLAAAAFAIVTRNDRLNRLEADKTLRLFLDESKEAQYLLHARPEDDGRLVAGIARCRQAVARYGVLDHDDWDRRPAFAALPPDDRQRVRRELTDACVFLARGSALRFQTGANPEGLHEAIRLNAKAEQVAGGDVPRDVFAQREFLMRKAGRTAAAGEAGRRAAAADPNPVRDQYTAALHEQAAGRYESAVAAFRAVQALDPKHYWAYFGEGVSHADKKKWAEARGCYTAAVALWPEFHWAYFNRGLANQELGDPAAAEADFARAVGTQPDFTDAYLGRAAARYSRGDYDGAQADLDRAAGLGVPPERTAKLRAQVRAEGGQPLDMGEPADEHGWIRRGLALLEKKDVAGAAEAFRRGTEANPKSADAVLFLVHALAEGGKAAECLPLLDRAVRLDGDNPRALAARGVLRARTRDWDGARADAAAALAKSTAASNLYQVAGIHARLSEHDPAARAEAMLLLGVALRAGYGFDHLATDPELDPVRTTPEFQQLVRDTARFRPAR